MIKLIWAMDPNGVIGNNGKLPWKSKEELKHFSKTTKYNSILMGRKTFDSLPGTLPNRKIIVLTREYTAVSNDKDIYFTNDLKSILIKYHGNINEDIYIAGGSNIYLQTLKHADELIVTRINKKFKGDCYFPVVNFSDGFRLIKKEEHSSFCVEYYKKIINNK